MNEDSGQLISIIALVISAGGIILGVVNHRRIKSNCCGKKMEASFDVDTTTPPLKISPVSATPGNS